MALELRDLGLMVAQEQHIAVYYRGQVVGEYLTDLVVNNVVIVELKAGDGSNYGGNRFTFLIRHEKFFLSNHIEFGEKCPNFGGKTASNRNLDAVGLSKHHLLGHPDF